MRSEIVLVESSSGMSSFYSPAAKKFHFSDYLPPRVQKLGKLFTRDTCASITVLAVSLGNLGIHGSRFALMIQRLIPELCFPYSVPGNCIE